MHNTIFFGTSRFAVLVLDSLHAAGMAPTLIVTTPDAPAGRGRALTPSPVKTWAIEHSIDFIQPAVLDAACVAELGNSEWDLFLVASYGKILPASLLSVPQHGVLNVHPSLLPKLRGATPIQSAILTESASAVGITIMQMDAEMDHGPIVAQARIELEDLPDSEGGGWPPSADVLHDLLATEGGNMLAETIPEWIAGNITPEPQDHEQATYTKKITKDMGELETTDGLPTTTGKAGYANFLKIQALAVNPGTYFFMENADSRIRVKVTAAEFSDDALHITHVIPEGKKEMTFGDFLERYTPSA